nr:TM2 domain-containing protein [uncultured Campylobacter sp.]
MSSTQSSAKVYDLNKAYAFYMFLGPFGAHRFYLGRIISAIFQLLGGLPFLIWLFLVVVAVMWTSIEGNELLALVNSSRPDLGVQASDLKDIEQGFFHFMVIFSVPNVLFLIWLISDFFRLPDMVRKLNVSVGAGAILYVYAETLKSRAKIYLLPKLPFT